MRRRAVVAGEPDRYRFDFLGHRRCDGRGGRQSRRNGERCQRTRRLSKNGQHSRLPVVWTNRRALMIAGRCSMEHSRDARPPYWRLCALFRLRFSVGAVFTPFRRALLRLQNGRMVVSPAWLVQKSAPPPPKGTWPRLRPGSFPPVGRHPAGTRLRRRNRVRACYEYTQKMLRIGAQMNRMSSIWDDHVDFLPCVRKRLLPLPVYALLLRAYPSEVEAE